MDVAPPAKPRVRLQGYDHAKYTVMVARKSGDVYVIGAWSHKGTAFRMSSQNSPSKDPRTHRSVIVRPGSSLLTAVNWLLEGLPEAMALRYYSQNED